MTQSRDHDASPRALIVAGPTASGKSALALDLAQRFGGVVINADSMQVYAGLRVLTARPTPAEEAAVPHRLYGVRPPGEAASVAWWRGRALRGGGGGGGRRPRLSGARPPGEAASVAWWRGRALAEMAAAHAAGRLPILCGGTGLYFLSLTEGLSELPPVPPEARAAARA